MIYTIERRNVYGYGSVETHYEVRRYERRSEHTGALLNGKTVKSFRKITQAKAYCRRWGIIAERI